MTVRGDEDPLVDCPDQNMGDHCHAITIKGDPWLGYVCSCKVTYKQNGKNYQLDDGAVSAHITHDFYVPKENTTDVKIMCSAVMGKNTFFSTNIKRNTSCYSFTGSLFFPKVDFKFTC